MCQGKLDYAMFSVGPNDSDAQVYTLEKVLKMKKDPISQIIFLDEAMKVGSILPTIPINLVILRRFWRVSQAQLSGQHWPGPWRSRPGTGRRVRYFSMLQAALKHLLRLNIFATNVEFWLSKAFASLPRLFLKNRRAYGHRVHTGATKVCICLVMHSVIYS